MTMMHIDSKDVFFFLSNDLNSTLRLYYCKFPFLFYFRFLLLIMDRLLILFMTTTLSSRKGRWEIKKSNWTFHRSRSVVGVDEALLLQDEQAFFNCFTICKGEFRLEFIFKKKILKTETYTCSKCFCQRVV